MDFPDRLLRTVFVQKPVQIFYSHSIGWFRYFKLTDIFKNQFYDYTKNRIPLPTEYIERGCGRKRIIYVKTDKNLLL